jgi:hypothetical protein
LIGIGNAPTMVGTHGGRSGRYSINEKYEEQIRFPWRPVHKGYLMKERVLAVVLFFVIVVLLAWSPWITQERAFSLVETQFNGA